MFIDGKTFVWLDDDTLMREETQASLLLNFRRNYADFKLKPASRAKRIPNMLINKDTGKFQYLGSANPKKGFRI
jgi:hypothetical protein